MSYQRKLVSSLYRKFRISAFAGMTSYMGRMEKNHNFCRHFYIKSLIIVFSLLLSIPTHAQDYSTQQQKLEHLRKQVEQTEAERAVTIAKIRRTSNAMEEQQQVILRKAAEIQKLERETAALGREVQSLFTEERQKSQKLEVQKGRISKMVSASWSMQNRPQLAAFLLPEDVREQALTSRSLHMTTISLKDDMDEMQSAMQELQHLRETIVEKQQQSREAQQRLKEERRELEQEVAAQQQLMAELQQTDRQHEEDIARLTKQATSLESLVQKLEAQHRKDIADFAHIRPELKPNVPEQSKPYKPPAKKLADNASPKSASFKEAKGVLNLPAEGVVIGKYGERRGSNDRLKGLEILTISGAVVSTPYQGEVLFTDRFLDYGNLVIVRHSHDYHTLIAGLSRINVTVGQFLLDGEPIGVMGHDKSAQTLYLELRHQSQAIDPAPWFALKPHHYAKR